MKPAPFDYFRPGSVDEAVAALGGSDAPKVLAGGQSLVPMLNFRLSAPTLLVDITGIAELGSVAVDESGVTIGASVTQSRVEQSSEIAAVVPGLRAALGHVGHLQIRNSGTVCGSLAHADPAAELPALAVALGAVLTVAGPSGAREVPAGNFFVGPFWTDLAPDEIVTSVRFPATPPGEIAVVDEISRRAGDFAVVGVAGSFRVAAGSIESASLAAFGVAGRPARMAAVESAIVGYGGGPDHGLAAAAAEDGADALDDLHADAPYRREALGALVARAARRAIAAGGSP